MRVPNGLLILSLALCVAACGPKTRGDHWRQVGVIDGGQIRIVELDAVGTKDAGAYFDAADVLCGANQCVQTGIFRAGDPIPAAKTRAAFDAEGGWSKYPPAAIYDGASSDFIAWDCSKAPRVGAPPQIACGAGPAR